MHSCFCAFSLFGYSFFKLQKSSYMSSKRLQAWLVLGTKWRDQQTLECPQWNEIYCREDLDFISIPDISPTNNDSDYPIEFGEL